MEGIYSKYFVLPLDYLCDCTRKTSVVATVSVYCVAKAICHGNDISLAAILSK